MKKKQIGNYKHLLTKLSEENYSSSSQEKIVDFIASTNYPEEVALDILNFIDDKTEEEILEGLEEYINDISKENPELFMQVDYMISSGCRNERTHSFCAQCGLCGRKFNKYGHLIEEGDDTWIKLVKD